MKNIVKKLLAQKAQKLIKMHNPTIIGITGSVGKTSVRNAIAHVLSKKFHVRATIKNYNNEFGLPLTIIGKESAGKSLFGWLNVLLSQPTDFPDVLVLEYGIDHPGDMKYLCDIAAPDISVFTRVSPVHAEFFSSVESLIEEKAQLLEHTSEDGLVLLNADDPRVRALDGHTKASVLTYGFSSSADLHVSDYHLKTREDYSFEPGETFSTIQAKVKDSNGDVLDIELENMLGTTGVSIFLPAIAIAKHMGMTHEEILNALPDTQFEPGRMNPLPGIKGSLIIDSSYNAAPASMNAALDILGEFQPAEPARRIAVLGDMAELGKYTDEEHRLVGLKVAEVGVGLLVTVGEKAQGIRRGAIEAGVPEEDTQQFNNAQEAGRWLDRQLKKGDIVLVKGSQSVRMEKVVKDIMAEPLHAKTQLVRQSQAWLEN